MFIKHVFTAVTVSLSTSIWLTFLLSSSLWISTRYLTQSNQLSPIAKSNFGLLYYRTCTRKTRIFIQLYWIRIFRGGPAHGWQEMLRTMQASSLVLSLGYQHLISASSATLSLLWRQVSISISNSNYSECYFWIWSPHWLPCSAKGSCLEDLSWSFIISSSQNLVSCSICNRNLRNGYCWW